VGLASIGLILLWSGSTKVKDPSGTAEAIASFGVLASPSKLLAYLLGVTELSIGAGDLGSIAISPLVERVFASATAVLFASFVVLISRSLAKGERFPCHCFGADERPLSRLTLLRTALLASIAVSVALGSFTAPSGSAREHILEFVIAGSLLGVISMTLVTKRLLHFDSHLRQIGGA